MNDDTPDDDKATRTMQYIILGVFLVLQLTLASLFVHLVNQLNNGNRAIVCMLGADIDNRDVAVAACLAANGLEG